MREASVDMSEAEDPGRVVVDDGGDTVDGAPKGARAEATDTSVLELMTEAEGPRLDESTNVAGAVDEEEVATLSDAETGFSTSRTIAACSSAFSPGCTGNACAWSCFISSSI
jgi:hypothetical protein